MRAAISGDFPRLFAADDWAHFRGPDERGKVARLWLLALEHWPFLYPLKLGNQ